VLEFLAPPLELHRGRQQRGRVLLRLRELRAQRRYLAERGVALGVRELQRRVARDHQVLALDQLFLPPRPASALLRRRAPRGARARAACGRQRRCRDAAARARLAVALPGAAG
jgi:hypothetical protein